MHSMAQVSKYSVQKVFVVLNSINVYLLSVDGNNLAVINGPHMS